MMGCDCIGTMKAAEDCTAYDPITRGVYEGLCHECAHKLCCHPTRCVARDRGEEGLTMADDVYVQMAREWIERESPRQPWHTGDAHVNFVAMAAFAREVAARTLVQIADDIWPCHFTETRAIDEWLRRRAEELRRG